MRILLAAFKRTPPGPDDGRGMTSSAAAKDAFRQSAIRFLFCIAALSVAGLALVITHPAWWPVSLVTAGSIPFLYHLAGLGRFHGTGAVGAVGVMERLACTGYSVWHDVPWVVESFPTSLSDPRACSPSPESPGRDGSIPVRMEALGIAARKPESWYGKPVRMLPRSSLGCERSDFEASRYEPSSR